MPPDDTRIRANPVTAPQPASRERAPQLARAALTLPPTPPVDASSLLSADSTPVGQSIPALARLLAGALRDTPAPLALRLETTPPDAAHAVARHPAAQALAEAVAGSGVFFESHLADWARGERAAAPMLAEARARAQAPASAPDTASEDVIRQQLSALVTGELAFSIPAWPGQSATLVIGQDPGQAPHAAPPERVYFARLELELPELGSVQATLKQNSSGIDIDLRAASTAAALALDSSLDHLARAFDAAGLRVGRVAVGRP